jgi:hypothetical protein
MAQSLLTLSPDELATLATIVVRYPGLASTVHAQVSRLVEIATVGRRDGLTNEAQVDELLLRVIHRVVAGTGPRDPATPHIADDAVETMVRLLARSSAAQARRRLVERGRAHAPADP